MQSVKTVFSRLRPPAAAMERFADCSFTVIVFSSLVVLTLAAIIFIAYVNLVPALNEQSSFVKQGYREKSIVAQIPCPVYKGHPFMNYSLDYFHNAECSLGVLKRVSEIATGRELSMLTMYPGAHTEVLSPDLRSLLRHYGLPGRVNVLAVYVDRSSTFAILECEQRTLSSLDISRSTIDPRVFIPNLYRNVHSLLASKAVSKMNLEGENIVFSASSVPYSNPLVLSFGETDPDTHHSERGPTIALYKHVRSVLHGIDRDGGLVFSSLLHALDSMLEPTVAIFHSRTHFNVSEVHYCFQSQLELLSPNASRLLGLYQAVFGLQELQPWNDRIITVHPLSAFGYPAVDYSSTLDDPSWSRLFFWDEPFSVGGWDSTPFDGINMVSLKFKGPGEKSGLSTPHTN